MLDGNVKTGNGYVKKLFVLCVAFLAALTIVDQLQIFHISPDPSLHSISLLNDKSSIEHEDPTSNKKIILFWTKFFRETLDGQHGPPALRQNFSGCDVQNCVATDDRTLVNESSAVIFHGIEDGNPYDIPKLRTTEQFYVLMLFESPSNLVSFSYPMLHPGHGDNFFNLTWSYRFDSDVVSSFYLRDFAPRLWTNRSKSLKSLRNKKDRALVFLSHCNTPSGRDKYIAELSRHFPVDVVGKCGVKDLDCPHWNVACEQRVADYKFYLAFENSCCRDYLTEKVFRAYRYETVPVVMGRASYSSILPPNSFIDTRRFASPELLAKGLWKLARNITLYERYFQWKYDRRHLRLPEPLQPERTDLCSLCRILNDKTRRSQPAIPSINDWFVKESLCKENKRHDFYPRWGCK